MQEPGWSLTLTLCSDQISQQPKLSFHGIFQARVLEWVAIAFSENMLRPVNVLFVDAAAFLNVRLLCYLVSHLFSAPWGMIPSIVLSFPGQVARL